MLAKLIPTHVFSYELAKGLVKQNEMRTFMKPFHT